MSGFPIWKYHKEKLPEGKIVRSAEEFEALGPGWVDSPAQFSEVQNENSGSSQEESKESAPPPDEGKAQDSSQAPGNEDKALEELSKNELLALAKEKGIKVKATLSKSALIEAIKGVK